MEQIYKRKRKKEWKNYARKGLIEEKDSQTQNTTQ